MEFDKSRVYTVVNADELKIGSKVIVADSLRELKVRVLNDEEPGILLEILSEYNRYRFNVSDKDYAALAYLVEEPAELKWTDLKVGDVIKCGKMTAMVTAINSEEGERHIFAGDVWFDNSDIRYWEKADENND